MFRSRFILLVLLFVKISSNFSLAQRKADHSLRLTLREVSVMDVEPSGSFLLKLNPPKFSGNQVVASRNSSKWINYSTSQNYLGVSRNISVQIEGGMPPEGVQINLKAKEYFGLGKGDFGHSAGEISLSEIPSVIISGIGSAYTGNGVRNGHKLIFSLKVNDYSLLESVRSETIITYTISQ